MVFTNMPYYIKNNLFYFCRVEEKGYLHKHSNTLENALFQYLDKMRKLR